MPCLAQDAHCKKESERDRQLHKVGLQSATNFQYDGHIWICFQKDQSFQVKHHPECPCHELINFPYDWE